MVFKNLPKVITRRHLPITLYNYAVPDAIVSWLQRKIVCIVNGIV